MGDRLNGEETSAQTGPRSYSDIFDELLPEYLAMGMTYDEYWDGEFGTKRAARKAYEIRVRNEMKLADRNSWYMGQYVIKALCAVPLLVAGLNVKQSTQLPQYPEKPFLETAEELKNEETRKKKEEDQAKLAMAMMQAAFTRFNKRFDKSGEGKAVLTGR